MYQWNVVIYEHSLLKGVGNISPIKLFSTQHTNADVACVNLMPVKLHRATKTYIVIC